MSTFSPGAALLGGFALLGLLAPRPRVRAQEPASAAVRQPSIVGHVVDRRREPVGGAEVRVLAGDSVIARAHVRADGAFEVHGVASGTRLVLIRRLGFKARTFDVDVTEGGPPARLEAVLTALPVELEQVRIEATIDDSKGKLREFYEHRARAQFGYFFGPDEIQRDRLRVASDIMRRVPGVKLMPARFGHRILFRGCRPLVWIDGQRVVGAELDDVMDIDDIAAIEIYPSMAGLPAQYVGYESRCGVIAVWTRVS